MEEYETGDVIEHKLMPGFRMEILDTEPCDADPEPHLAYQVIDPEGCDDWLCAYDVQRVG